MSIRLVLLTAFCLIGSIGLGVKCVIQSNQCLNTTICSVNNNGQIIFNNTNTKCHSNSEDSFSCKWPDHSSCPIAVDCSYIDLYFILAFIFSAVSLALSIIIGLK